VRFLLNNEEENLDKTLVSLVEIQNNNGETPLDVVNTCLRRKNAERANDLAERLHGGDVDAARRLLQQYNQESEDVVQLLLQHYQRVVTMKKGDGGLHWIIREAIYENDGVVLPLGKLTIDQMVALLNLLVTANPNLITTVDTAGALPVHAACRRSGTPLEVIQFLVGHAPGTVLIFDLAGNLPLHALCTSKPSVRAVQCLLGDDVPNAFHGQRATVTATNHLGFMPITVASLFDASEDVLFLLLSKDSEAGTNENLRLHFIDRQF